jgi:hypothetical protein
MEHVVALAKAEDVPAEVREAAAYLRDTPPLPPTLIQLGKADMRALEAAKLIVEHAQKLYPSSSS